MLNSLHTFFYKNTVYKNIEPHFGSNVKNFFIAQIMGDFLMFLSSFLEAQITKVGAKTRGKYGFFGQILTF